MGKSRTSGTKLSKDTNEGVIREIRRVFAEMGNRIHLGACAYAERMQAVTDVVMRKILRPWRVSAKQWRRLVWQRLNAFKNGGVLQFDDGNVARLSHRQMKRAESAGQHDWAVKRATVAREGRRGYTDRYRRASLAY